MEPNEQRYLVGELARATGLTVRTLQHYDNIGLLPPSGRTEGGRRYYTRADLIRLEQIAFYKSIGIGLAEIREKLGGEVTLDALERTLSDHLSVLTRKIEALHLAKSAMHASLDVVRAGHFPPWEVLTGLIRAMDGSGMSDWADYPFDQALMRGWADQRITEADALEMYRAIREMMLDAAALSQAGASVEGDVAQRLAARWWAQILRMTDGSEASVAAFGAVSSHRETWPEADRGLFAQAEPFLEAALAVYIERNGIQVPEAFLEGQP